MVRHGVEQGPRRPQQATHRQGAALNRDLAKRVFALVPPALARHLPSPARERVLWLLQASLERFPRSFAAHTPLGFELRGSTRDVIQRFVYVYGVWEPELTRWTRGFLRAGDVAIDIGANCGYYTLLFARCVGPTGAVVAVEPVPSIFARLQQNVRANGFANVAAHAVAAGAENGELEIFRSEAENLGWSGTLPATAASVSEGTVPVRRIAEVVPLELWPRVRLVKIDIEGDEQRALSGLAEVLAALPAGAAVVVEVTPAKLAQRGQSARGVFELLQDMGFSAHTLGDPPQELADVPSEQADVLFLKNR